ncbi:MAG: 50S ribosomal protein L17 [Phycisphaera sp.]|nr:50S ribosomal protein L17 [Phycisphaera sp.]
MRHGMAGYKLGRDTEHRTAMFRNLAAALFQHGQITTSRAKAKAVQPFVEKLITLAKRGDLHSRRLVIARLQDRDLVDRVNEFGEPEFNDKTLVQKLFDEIAPRYADRAGGFTRIVRLADYRIGDGTDLVVLQLVGEEEESSPRVKGRYSRRRQQQDARTAFAAKLRKGAKADTKAAPADAVEAAAEGMPDDPAPEEAAAVEPTEAETSAEGETKSE